MRRQFFTVLLLGCLVVSSSGCVALLAGAAGGAGTAAWLSNKLTKEVNASFQKAINASKKGIASLNLKVTKETVKEEVAQIKSEYYDGKDIWIDIHHVSDKISRIEVRVGLTGDEEAARRVLDKILKYL